MDALFHSSIRPDIFNENMFFNGNFGNSNIVFEIEKYLVTKSVDIKGYSRHFLGVVMERSVGVANVSETDSFNKLSSFEKFQVFEKMIREYAGVYKSRNIHYIDFARAFGLDFRYSRNLYRSVPDGEFFSNRKISRVRFDGWEFPYTFARHFLIYGQSRTGKSVTLMKCAKVCMDNGWVVVDINDSNGRMETGAAGFSLYDAKVFNILKTRWREAKIDSKATAQRMVNDIEKLRGIVTQFSDLDDVDGYPVVYHHPLVDGIPKLVPKTDKFSIEFFVFSVRDMFDMVNSSNYRRIFSVFGDDLTDVECGNLSHIRRFLDGERKLDTISLSEVIRMISDLHDSKEQVTIVYSDGGSRSVDFSDRSIRGLIRKLDRINDIGLFKPGFVICDGSLVENPDLFDVRKIVSKKGTFNCLSTKWANPDLKYFLTAYFLDKLMEYKRHSEIKENVALLCRELYEFAPPMAKGYEIVTFDMIKRICAGGADLGIRLIADSQQVMQVSREVKRNIHGIIVHKVVDSADKDDLRKSLSKHYMPREYRDFISELGMGEAIVFYSNQAIILKVIPVHFMSKIEGTDTFSLLMVYSDDKIDTSYLFDDSRYKSVGVDGDVIVNKTSQLYPRLLKKHEVVLNDTNELHILTALSMILRKEEFISFEELYAAVSLLYDENVSKFNSISLEEFNSYISGNKSKKFGKFLIVDHSGDSVRISIDNGFFGYDVLTSLCKELFVELIVMFGLDSNSYL